MPTGQSRFSLGCHLPVASALERPVGSPTGASAHAVHSQSEIVYSHLKIWGYIMDLPFQPTGLPAETILTCLAIATILGLILGLDRELRGIAAGIRTHALVSVSSAVITLSALILFGEAHAAGRADPDPLRVIQGLTQAIGFISAGIIFVWRGDVHNLTSAANIWLAAAVGIAAGAGQLFLAAVSVLIGVFLLAVVRIVEHFIPGSDKARRD